MFSMIIICYKFIQIFKVSNTILNQNIITNIIDFFLKYHFCNLKCIYKLLNTTVELYKKSFKYKK
jgi:hypothetical protein